MKNLRKHLLIGMTALSLGSGALAVHAADVPAGGDKPKAEAHEHGKDRARMQERMEKRAKALHDSLKLTPEQEPAWNKFTDAMKPSAPPAERPNRAKITAMTAPERMQFMLDRMKDAEVRMARHAAAVQEFYRVLTPEQQKVFDKHFAKMHRPGRGMHGPHRSPMGPHGDHQQPAEPK